MGNILTGDISAKGVARNQPEKLAAMEGVFEPDAPADVHLFGWVRAGEERVIGVKAPVPGFSAGWCMATGRTPVPGLKSFPADERPPVNIVFQAYHGMVAVGMLLFGLTLAGLFFLWRGTLVGAAGASVGFRLCGAGAADRQPAGLDHRRGRATALDRL